MDDKTYSDPKIISLIRAHYIAVRVDQDSRPDLANRYEDYGWPAHGGIPTAMPAKS